MRIVRLILLAVFILAHAVPLSAVTDPLWLPRLSRYTGFGFSGIAVDLGPELTLLNPSSLVRLDKKYIEVNQTRIYDELNSTAVMVTSLGKIAEGNVSAFYAFTQSSPLHVTEDENNDNLPDVMSTFSSSYHGFLASYSRRINDIFDASIGIKTLYESLHTASAYGYGFDLGLTVAPMRIGTGVLNTGVAIYDLLGTSVTWSTGRKEVIGQRLRFGMNYGFEVFGFSGAVVADIDSDYGLSYGGAVTLPDVDLTLRGGQSGTHTAFGISLILSGLDISAAYILHQELGGSYTFSLGYDFASEFTTEKAIKRDIIKDVDPEILDRFEKNTTSVEDYFDSSDLKETIDIEQELKELRKTKQEILEDEDELVPYMMHLVPSTPRAGETVEVSFTTPKNITHINAVTVWMNERMYDLTDSSVNGIENFTQGMQSLMETGSEKIFSGPVVMPDTPGKYPVVILIQTPDDIHSFTETIIVR